MTIFGIFSFFVIMLVLAAIPSASVGLVVVRSVTCGRRHGLAVALGIVLGDLIFVAIAVAGVSALAAAMGSFFGILKYVGGAYLVWLGIRLLFAQASEDTATPVSRQSSMSASVIAGLLLTLGDLKAVLFYASLFPVLMNMAQLTVGDILMIVAVTVVTVGGVKAAYAVAAQAIVARLRLRRATRHLNRAAGGLLLGAGAWVIAKS